MYKVLVIVISAKNLVTITQRDVDIEKSNGDPVNYIKAPGTYRIHFKKIVFQREFQFLSGDLSALLEVPFASNRILRYDAPYSIIPEKSAHGGQKCDDDAGVVKHFENRQPLSFW